MIRGWLGGRSRLTAFQNLSSHSSLSLLNVGRRSLLLNCLQSENTEMKTRDWQMIWAEELIFWLQKNINATCARNDSGCFLPITARAISPNIERNLPPRTGGRNHVHAPDRLGDSTLLAPLKSPMFALYQFKFICCVRIFFLRTSLSFAGKFCEIRNKTKPNETMSLTQKVSLVGSGDLVMRKGQEICMSCWCIAFAYHSLSVH